MIDNRMVTDELWENRKPILCKQCGEWKEDCNCDGRDE